MLMLRFLGLSAVLTLCAIKVDAQRGGGDPTFGLSTIAGINLSQVDGDNFTGYDKVGFQGGLRGVINIGPALNLRMELLYSQKGSRFESAEGFRENKNDRAIKLQYADIPIVLAYRVNNVEAKSRMWLYAGVSFGALLGSEVQDAENPGDKEFIYEDIVDDFKTTEFSFVGGAEYDLNKKIGVGLRYTAAFTKFYEDEEPTPTSSNVENVEFLRNYYISLYALYHF